MNRRLPATLLALVLLPALVRAVELEDLRPGLVAVHSAGKVQVAQLEPAAALTLKADEAVHPRLAPTGSSEWTGYVNLLRGGTYRFEAALRGKVRVQIDGKDVLGARVRRGGCQGRRRGQARRGDQAHPHKLHAAGGGGPAGAALERPGVPHGADPLFRLLPRPGQGALLPWLDRMRSRKGGSWSRSVPAPAVTGRTTRMRPARACTSARAPS